MNLFTLVERSVRRHAERTAYLVKEGGTYRPRTYADWFSDLTGFSAFLVHRLGVAHGETVGLVCDNRYEWKWLSLGIATVGSVDVPRGCDATESEIRAILAHAGCRVVVAEGERVVRKIARIASSLPQLRHVISVEGPDTYRELPAHRESLDPASIHFLADGLEAGVRAQAEDRLGELERRRRAPREEDLATLIYTSGTTGAPKGVMLDHRALVWSAEQLAAHLPFTAEDRVILFLPPWHIAERMLQLLAVSVGASMAVSSPATLMRDFPAAQPTVMLSVPRIWESLHRKFLDRVRGLPAPKRLAARLAILAAEVHRDQIDHLFRRFAETSDAATARRRRLRVVAALLVPFTFLLDLPARRFLGPVRAALGGRLRFAMSGGGALPTEVVRFFRSLRLPILDAYGMTETSALGAMGRSPWPSRGAIGPVFPGCEIELRDESGRRVGRPGEIGVAWHRGPHVTQGYYRNPEATKREIVDGWLNSGDLLTWTTTGELRYAGRAKDTIVMRSGENVEPEPIELALTATGFVRHAVVVGQDRKTLGALIVPAWESASIEIARRGGPADLPPSAWNDDPDIRRFYAAVLQEALTADRGFKPHERIRGFRLLERDFEPGGELTQTLKIRRAVVLERFAAEVESLFEERP